MKVLTLHQPWASLISLGVKSIETRSWSTQYRGPLAIHAAKSVDYEGWTVGEWKWDRGHDGRSILGRRWSGAAAGKGVEVQPLPLGAIVATCTLVDVVPIIAPNENPFERFPCVQTFVGFGEFPDGWLELYHPTMGNSVDREGSGRSLPFEAPYGLFEPGRYAWLLADIVPVDPPVPFRGGQGLTKTWTPDEVPA